MSSTIDSVPDVSIPDEVIQLVRHNRSSAIAVLKNKTVAYVNKPWLALFGYSRRAEVVGRHVSEFIAPESMEIAEKRLRKMQNGKAIPRQRPYRFIHRKGTLFYAEVLTVGWPTDPDIVIAIGVDVTSRIEGVAALRSSEELFRALSECMPAAVILKNADGTNIYVNEEAVRITGFSREELLGTQRLVHPDEEHALAMYTQGLISFVPFRDLETRFIRKDGSVIWVSAGWEPFRDKEGKISGICSTFIDITRRKQAEEQLLAKSAELEAIIGAFPDAYFRLSEHGTLLSYTGPPWPELGQHPSSNIGRHVSELVPPETVAPVLEALDSVLQTGRMAALEFALNLNGSERFYEARMSPFPGGQVVAVVREITERRRVEQDLRDMNERYQLITDHAADIIWQMDQKGVFTYVSRAANTLGYRSEDIVGRALAEFLPEEDRERFFVGLADELANPGPKNREIRMRRKDGSFAWLEVVYDTLVEEGQPARAQGISRDITLRKVAEQALIEAEERYRLLAENASDLLWQMDLQGNFTYVSPAVKYYGYTQQEWIGHSIVEFLPTAIRQDFLPRFHERVKALGPRRHEVQMSRRDGSLIWVEVSVDFVLENGVPVRVQGIARDISERKQSEEVTRKAHADLARAYALQRQFLNNVTHEVRTPLTAVQGYAMMLLEGTAGPVTDEQRSLLDRIVSSSRHLLNMVDGVLEIARIKSGTMALHTRVCKPHETLEQAASAVLPQAAAKNLQVRVEANERERLGVYDEDKLNIIIANLLSNAVKFTESGSVDVLVEYGAAGFEVVIADSGIGISENDILSIFDEFQQLDYPGKHKPSGFGLGLAIVANMTEAIHASLTVSSAKGVGTAFTLRVPTLAAEQ